MRNNSPVKKFGELYKFPAVALNPQLTPISEKIVAKNSGG